MDGDPNRIVLGAVAALGVAAVVGLVNGLIISGLKVNAFIATLGTGLLLKAYLDTRYKGPAGSVPSRSSSSATCGSRSSRCRPP